MQTVTILQSEYDQLIRDQMLLEALRAAGVDNWDGWEEAYRTFRGWEAEDE